MVASLRKDIREFTGDYDYSGAIVFLGRQEAISNPSCIEETIGVMGQSFFNWDTDVDPQYYYSSRRIILFLNCFGSSFTIPSVNEVIDATEMMSSMSCYPNEGSIAWCGDTVVVKLSEE